MCLYSYIGKVVEISKQSWHYKLITDAGMTPSKTLCSYVGQILSLLVIYFIILFVVIFFFPVILGMCIAAPLSTVFEFFNGTSVLNFFIIYLIGLATSILIVIIYFNFDKLKIKINKSNRKPSLVLTYLKDLKNKYCTLLQFKDD